MQTTRPLSARQLGSAFKTAVAVNFLIREIDQLEGTNVFKQKLKQTGKSFLAELEKHAAECVWKQSPEGNDVNEASNQMDELTDQLGNFLITLISTGPIDEGQMHLFWNDMQMTFKRHKMPLRITPDGVLELSAINV